MYDPQINEAIGEWVELYNRGPGAVTLRDCMLADYRAFSPTGNVIIPAGGYVFFAGLNPPADERWCSQCGLVPDGYLGISLGNGGDRLLLRCNNVSIDQVQYGGNAWPIARGASLNLSENALDADANNDGESWCVGTHEYFANHFGSPGEANESCDACESTWADQLGQPCFEGTGACGRAGVYFCNAEGTLQCSGIPGGPSDEICNDIDDDCDGSVDEEFTVGEECGIGIGACRGTGERVCLADGSGVRCSAVAGAPAFEICDDRDQDCDGRNDEGLGLGAPCSKGVGECRREGNQVCAADGRVTCSVVAGTSGRERCNGLDDDCDGRSDEDFSLGEACVTGLGACGRDGVFRCNARGAAECSADPGLPGVERCNAVDDDCDGELDEGFALGTPCEAGRGACRREGTTVCLEDGAAACDANPGLPAGEACNGIDDDCDGIVDGAAADDACPEGAGCVAGHCVRSPRPGDVVISEIMYAPVIDDARGEWVELANITALPMSLSGCRLATDEGDSPLGDLEIPAEGQIFLAGLQGPLNEEWCDQCGRTPNGVLGVSLDNAGGRVRVECGDVLIDQVQYGGMNWPVARGASLSLSGDRLDGVANDDGAAWCLGSQPYFVGHNGTPGLPNGVCERCDPENPDNVGGACAVGVGSCSRAGVRICGDGGLVRCDAAPGLPSPERCNQLDDDCDGEADETLGVGTPCLEGVGVCQREGATRCGADGDLRCDAVPGLPGIETCDFLDDDCDGRVDEELGLGVACSDGVGQCRAQGETVCADDGGVVCSVSAGAPNIERCNRVDDDCDGQSDEGYDLGAVCSAGLGACRRDGVLKCTDEGLAACSATPRVPTLEACNAIDDDCDGVTDEGLGIGGPCDVGLGLCRRTGVVFCGADGSRQCSVEAGEAGQETCNGIDDDCNGVVDDNLAVDACPGAARCIEGQCLGTPDPGDIVITEIMYDPQINEALGEWIEVYNRTDTPMSLGDCQIADYRGVSSPGNIVLAPGAYGLFAGQFTPVDERWCSQCGQLPDGHLGISLGNGGDRILFRCDNELIDQVQYGGNDWPVARNAALALSADAVDGRSNDQAASWCLATNEYFANHTGTPGAPNPVCDRCNPNPCTDPPPAECDGDTAVTYQLPGICTVENAVAACDWIRERTACSANERCVDGACVDRPLDRAGTCDTPGTITRFGTFNGSTENGQSILRNASCGAGGNGRESVYTLLFERETTVCLNLDGSAYDTVLHVRTECGNPAQEVACNDNDEQAGGRTSALTMVAEANTVYYVIVDGFGIAKGQFSLSVSNGVCGVEPQRCAADNDCEGGQICALNQCIPGIECEDEEDCEEEEVCGAGYCRPNIEPGAACLEENVVLLDGFGVHRGNTIGHPMDLTPTEACSSSIASPEVAHVMVLDEPGLVCATTSGSDFDTVLSVRADDCFDGREAVCNDDVNREFDLQSRVEFRGQAGVPYYFIVDGYDDGLINAGDYALTVTPGGCRDAPPVCELENNCPGNCDEPALIEQFGEFDGTTDGAGSNLGIATCESPAGSEAVYLLDLGYDGTTCLSTYGSDAGLDTVLHVRSQCDEINSELACNDDFDGVNIHSELELEASAGDSYYVIVDTLRVGGGDFLLTATPGNCPECHADPECDNGYCEAGACVMCREDVHCPRDWVCDGFECRPPPCNEDAECGEGRICEGLRCIDGRRPPPSCRFENIVDLPLDGGPFEGSTVGAPVENEATCAETGDAPEVTHRLVSDRNRTLCVNTDGSDFDTVVYLRTDCGDDATESVCADDIAVGENSASKLTINVRAGFEYFLIVDGQGGADGAAPAEGNYVIDIDDGPCPQCEDDDDCPGNRICEGRLCVQPPECDVDDECEGELVCEAQICVAPPQPCEFDFQCPGEMTCDGEICIQPGVCAQPIPYVIGSVARGSTADPGDGHHYAGTCGGVAGIRTSNEEVFSFASGSAGWVCLSTVGSGYDTVMYVRRDECAAGVELECNDDENFNLGAAGNKQSAFELNVQAGGIYYVFVDGYGRNSAGEFMLSSSFGRCGDVPPAQCDATPDCGYGEVCTELQQCVAPIGTCEQPVPLSGFGEARNMIRGAPNIHESRCGGTNGSESVYQFVAENTGDVCVDTGGSSYDTVIHVRQAEDAAGCNVIENELGCSDDLDTGEAQGRLHFRAIRGRRYYIIADAHSRTGELVLTVSQGVCR